MKKISTTKAAQPLGHYSQAVVHNGTVYVATQLGIEPNAEEIVVGSLDEQTKIALNNISAILEEAGSSMSQVLKVTIFIADIAKWDVVNAEYGKFFGEHKPARGVIPCDKLHLGFEVAFDVVAAI